ncbi:MAG: type II toxin-antitoxin system YafQ family toxin [Bacteroidales bacterium]|jgi:mRNA interferase YafQ|nr:type II toxin-antitoxin system YafQ family toxin [Bacteroidales bacterium]
MSEMIYKYSLDFTNKFKKDVKLANKRNLNLSLLEVAIDILQREGVLPPEYKAHPLKGKYNGIMECHIQPDWLLLWKQDNKKLTLLMMSTGTHSDMF